MTRRRVFSILIAAFVPQLSSCCSKSSSAPNEFVFKCDSEPKLPRVGVNTFVVSLATANGEAVRNARIAIEGDMSHPGMSPVFGNATESAPGQYKGALQLTMQGDWTILFHITLHSGQSFDREMQLRGLQAQ